MSDVAYVVRSKKGAACMEQLCGRMVLQSATWPATSAIESLAGE